MRYIVFWCLMNWIPEPCPLQNQVDEFGREILYGCLVMHGHFEQGETQSKVFTDRDSAFAFYKRALDEGMGCVDIDSTEVK